MKMKDLFNPQPVRRRCLALTFAVGLCGVASAPAAALNADQFSAQVAGFLNYVANLQQKCQLHQSVQCAVYVPTGMTSANPLLNSRFDRLWRAL